MSLLNRLSRIIKPIPLPQKDPSGYLEYIMKDLNYQVPRINEILGKTYNAITEAEKSLQQTDPLSEVHIKMAERLAELETGYTGLVGWIRRHVIAGKKAVEEIKNQLSEEDLMLFGKVSTVIETLDISSDHKKEKSYLDERIEEGYTKVQIIEDLAGRVHDKKISVLSGNILKNAREILQAITKHEGYQMHGRMFLNYYLDAAVTMFRGLLSIEGNNPVEAPIMKKRILEVLKKLDRSFKEIRSKVNTRNFDDLNAEMTVLEKALESEYLLR